VEWSLWSGASFFGVEYSQTGPKSKTRMVLLQLKIIKIRMYYSVRIAKKIKQRQVILTSCVTLDLEHLSH